jgi:hypothetical protein
MKNDSLPAAIQAEGLTKQYAEVTAVDSLDLAVRPGEIYGFPRPERRRENHDHPYAPWADPSLARQGKAFWP